GRPHRHLRRQARVHRRLAVRVGPDPPARRYGAGRGGTQRRLPHRLRDPRHQAGQLMTTGTTFRGSGGAEPGRAAAEAIERALFEVKRVIVGQDRLIERLFVALIARGHCLLEGAPGLAQTLAAETLATVAGRSVVRLQFTPDLVPSDIVGTRIYRPSSERFDIELGPIFANVVLADEINRAPAEVQAALLEVIAEDQVSRGGVPHPVPQPLTVLATQNPIQHQ